MAALRQAVLGYSLALCRSITACKDIDRLLVLLQQAVGTLIQGTDGTESHANAADDELSACRSALLAAVAEGGSSPTEAAVEQQPSLAHEFYTGPAFQDLAEVLLTVVAPNWLPRMSQQQRHQLFDIWFQQAPAVLVLPLLTSHLSAVQPGTVMAPGSGRAHVTAVSADEAASLLAARFAAPGSTGVREVLQDIVVAAATAPAAGGVLSAAPASQRQAQAWQVQEEGLAAALASAPERAAAVQLPALEAAVYVPAVAAQLLDLLAADSLPAATQAMQLDQQQAQQQAQQPDQQQDQQQQQAATPAGAGTAFVADVLARFCRRGHQQLVVGAMLQRLMPGGQAPRAAEAAMASSIVAALPDSTALEKLLEAALKVAVQFNTHRTAPAPLPLNASPDADPAATAAAAMLSALLPPAVWQARVDARLLLTDSLLVKRQRGMLPLSALRGLLLFLHQREESAGSSSGSGSSEARHGLLPDVACRVAQLWGDTAAVQRLAAQQQAFLTAALCCCLRLMARRQLDGHPQLLQLCLAGITARLDSPLLGVRRQAMRVGQSLSALLDPAKPPMFAEDEQLWQLLPEEVWEAPATAPPAPPYSSSAAAAAADNPPIRQQPAAAAAGGTARGTSSRKHAGSSGGREERRAAREERRRAQAAKRQARSAHAARFEEAEGPQTETDSDDAEEGSSSISSSGTEAGSTSSGEFEQYDLEESDEEDPARSKLQLRDLPKMLLSKAEEDWRGQVRALRHAEYLIRAAPDELEQYAVPLARALVHSKVPAWMDEEMPEGGPLANTQRFRNVVSLLAGAPESAGLALAAEMYGPSMDVYQRAMILDSMAAAAAEISKPGSALPPLPGLHPKPPPALASEASVRAAAAAAGLSPEQQRLLTTTADGSKRVGTVTRLASRSLAAAAARKGKQTYTVNRFPPIALKWAAALLKHCGEPRQGINLLGQDHFLLGKLLVTLGSFLEASAQSVEAATLAAATLELMRCGRVHSHPEPFVRRAALLAAGHVLGAVPPARVAAAMLTAAAGGGSGTGWPAAAAASDVAEEALVSRLEWLREWVEGVASHDTDDSCRMMADGVRKLQANLAAGALAALDSSTQGGALAGGSLLPLPSAGGGAFGLPAGGLQLPDIRLP